MALALGVASLTVASLSAANQTAGFPNERVRIGPVHGCWPVAVTTLSQEQGLMGVSQPARPMLFLYQQPNLIGYWMKDTPAPLHGVWIGTRRTVIGFWTGIPESLTGHAPPAPVIAVAEFPVGWKVPALGALMRVGGRCSSDRSL